MSYGVHTVRFSNPLWMSGICDVMGFYFCLTCKTPESNGSGGTVDMLNKRHNSDKLLLTS